MKHLTFVFAHLSVIVVCFILLNLFSPSCVAFYCKCIISIIIILFAAIKTFEFAKGCCLKDRISSEKRAVFITGCDRGFGHELAKRLDSLGFQVFAGCLFPSGEGACELKSKCSERLKIVEQNVTKDESVKESLNFVKSNLGDSELWAIVNNAGILTGGTSEVAHLEVFKGDMEVNTYGTIRVTQAFLPLLRQSRGRVVNVTSRAARIALPFIAPYTVSKYAVLGFTECLRHEVDVWGIKVISIEPEVFKTGMTALSSTMKNCDRLLRNLDDGIRETLGDKYIENCRKIPEIWDTIASKNIDAVINSLEAAVCLKYPSSVYQPCRNLLMGIMLDIGEIKFFSNLFFKLCMHLCGLQTVPQSKKQL